MAKQVYLDINARPRQVLQVMEQMTRQAGDQRQGQKRIWLATGGLLLVGLLFWAIDVLMGYANSGFAALGCFFCLAAPSALALALAMVVSSVRLPRAQFDAAHKILHTLRDDVGRQGRVTGWLDLTGAQKQSKLLRSGRTSSGRAKYYYSDPWFVSKIRLVDGSLLRLSLVQRIKVKRGYVADQRHQLKVRLVFDPQVYSLAPGRPLQDLALDGSILSLQLSKITPFTADEVLAQFKRMYSYLTPRQPNVPQV